MPKYTVTYTFDADDDQEASDIWRGGYYLEGDMGEPSWEPLPEKDYPVYQNASSLEAGMRCRKCNGVIEKEQRIIEYKRLLFAHEFCEGKDNDH